MALIPKSEIDDFIITSHGWNYIDEKLKKTFHFKTYMESIEFINELAKISERLNHHPDMVVGWCKIDIYFTSHDLGGVTDGCLHMAREADKVL